MQPQRKQRLFLLFFVLVLASLGIYLLIYVLGENKNFFYSPTRFVNTEIDENKTIRVGGCVVFDSIKRTGKDLEMTFEITDGKTTIPVSFNKILPDLFAEGEAAVAVGKTRDGMVVADKILAKHDENYMPPEVTQSLKSRGIEIQSCAHCPKLMQVWASGR